MWRITPAEPTPSHTHTHRERDIAHTMNGFVYEIRIMQSIEIYLPPSTPAFILFSLLRITRCIMQNNNNNNKNNKSMTCSGNLL